MTRRNLLFATTVLGIILIAIMTMPVSSNAGEAKCGHFYGHIYDDGVNLFFGHSGDPLDELAYVPPGDWEQDHAHEQYTYEMWHDYFKDGWLESSTEWDHINCDGGGS